MQHVLGVNVGSLIAAAGVAGLVIAFAAQNTVSNLFGALSLVMDKPFKEGDRISCNGADGIVEFMGLRASRIRSLEGQEIIIPNHILADNQLINYSDRQHFRHIFNIRLGYGTPPERIEEAVRILHEILDNREMTVPGRRPIIAFNEMQEWAFNISAFVWYDTTDWAAYQADLHLVNLEILRRFRAAGITFAIPASVNYLMGDEKQTAPNP
jgi:MscS family membrane protein